MKKILKTMLLATVLVFSLVISVYAASTNTFSAAEVAKHAAHDDCWMIIDGKVYDFTKFMDKHPAGLDTIVASCGQEATEAFDQCHKPELKKAIKAFYIGDLKK